MWISLSFHLGHWFDSFSTVGLRNSLRANKKGWGRQRDFTFSFSGEEKSWGESWASRGRIAEGGYDFRKVCAQISRSCEGTNFEVRPGSTAAFIAAQKSRYGRIYCGSDFAVRLHDFRGKVRLHLKLYGCIYFLHKNRGTAWVYGLYDSARVSRDCTASFNAVRPVCWHKFRGTVRLSFCWTVALNVGTEIEKNGLLNIFPDCWWR